MKRFHEDNPTKAGPPVRLQRWLEVEAKGGFCEDHEDDDKPATKGAPLRRSMRKKRK